MPFIFDCASCGAELRLPLAPPIGAQLNCPQCRGMLTQHLSDSSASPGGPPAPVNPYAAPLQSSEPPREELDDAKVQKLAQRLVKEKQDRTTSLQLLITGIIACFSPILAIYGTIFLILRPYKYPGKWMAVAGTLLHWIWTVLAVVYIIALSTWS